MRYRRPPDVVYPYYDDPDEYETAPYYDDEEVYEREEMLPDEERKYLENYLKDLEGELAEARKRLEQLKKKR